MRAAIAILAALLLAPSARASEGVPRRFAIVAGASDGGATRPTLRFATSDARQVARVLRRLGGIALDDLLLVEEPDAPALRAAIARVAAATAPVRRAGGRVELFVYFSGHSDEAGLLLGGTQLPYPELRAAMERIPADVRVAILDSCSSGAFTRTKGGVHRPPFLLDASSSVKGHAFLTSSAADEASQESDRLKGSFFTHALLTGLRGAADASNDGVVTLNEAYQFAYRETLARTEATQSGAQHATYDIGLVGSGDVVMTDLRRADAVLVIPPALEGTVFVRNAAGQLVAELRKVRGAGVELALEEGRYDLRVSLDRNVSSASVELVSSSRVVLDLANLVPTPLEVTTRRGTAGAPAVGEPASPPATGAPAATSLPPLALPGARPATAMAPSAPTPRAAPLAAAPTSPWGRRSWAITAGTFAPQSHLKGAYGFAAQASAGTWLNGFVGIDASLGLSRIEADTNALFPVTVYTGPTTWYDALLPEPCHDTLWIVPLETTLRVSIPTPGFRPYLLGGVGLQIVHLARELVGVNSGDPVSPRTDVALFDDVVLGFHAGIGATVPLGPNTSAVFEGTYRTARTRITRMEEDLGPLDLSAIRITAGISRAF